jgi:hypothetical protein
MKPTIGRKVWFRLNGATIGATGAKQPEEFVKGQAMDATVVCVWGDMLVNLSVTDHGGAVHGIRSVPLRPEDGPVPQGMYCEWMPYQVSQAAKQPDPVLFPIERATADAVVRIIKKIEAQIDRQV